MLTQTSTRVLISLTSMSILLACGGGSGPDGGSGGAAAGGSVGTTGGAPGSGGGLATGGMVGVGGVPNTGGSATGGSATGGAGTGGVTGGSGGGATGGSPSSGGTTATGGAAGGTGASGGSAGGGSELDQNGKANAPKGSMTSMPQDYLRIGDIRILNNNWGSEDLGCFAPTSTMDVFVSQDGSFGWNFARGNCDTAGANSSPDFPQLEFGVHPFGLGSDLATSPDFSSTTLLPLQIKDITTASVSVQNLNASFQAESSWNITFEFWLSERDPINDPNPGVYAELMTFWGWQANRWPDSGMMPGPIGNGAGQEVGSAGKTYKLWVQDDAWAGGKWRYFQFRDNAGPQKSFNGSVDVKAFLDYLVNTRGYSQDLWVTRLEVGSEIDDETRGTVSMQGVTFEVNGESRSQVLAP